MSAPPLIDHPAAMPTMVSRLPKFGSQPKSAGSSSGSQMGPVNGGTFAAASSTRLTNGFYHHPGPAGVTTTTGAAPPHSIKQNGFIRVPTSFSMKWRKEKGLMEDGEREWRRGKGGNGGQTRPGTNIHQPYSQRQLVSPVVSQHDTKKNGKWCGLGQPVMPSSSPQSSPRTLPVSKSGSYGPKLSQTGLTNGTKPTLNGLCGPKSQSRIIDSLRRPQSFGGSRPGSGPGSRSGSPLLKKPPASRSHSTDSLGSASTVQLAQSDRFRSRSLTQVRQHPSSPHVTNRPAERGLKEPTAPSTQAPPRGGGVRVQSSAASGRSGLSTLSLLPPSALKKPLLSSLVSASKACGVSYKMSRPSLVKQARPLRVTQAIVSGSDQEVNLRGWKNSAETPSMTENSPETTQDTPETEGVSGELVSQAEVSIVGGTLEEMSLSSTSSLDRNDTSQEYMDDFDNLGNGGIGVMLLSSKNEDDDSGLDQSSTRFNEDKGGPDGVTGLCFLDDGVDWDSMTLSGEREEQRLSRLSRQRRPSQPEYHDQGGSSLDLSPSDSCGSGGTYMWDEEGLEPLGGAAMSPSINTKSNTTHHIGSFDPDVNSIDILNNLDSCDLDDDDLMLDADLAEDTSLHSDGDGMSHMAQWRKRQLCWGMQDVHNDNESDLQCYQLTEDPGNQRNDGTRDGDLVLDLRPPRSASLSPGTPSCLNVEELAEDCSTVRSQLEYLQRLLLQEEDVDDDTLTTDTVSPEENDSSQGSDMQVQALLQEVQQLREELRSRDRTIAQLTLQLTAPMATTRCCCQEMTRMDRQTQTSETERESVASQTPWREHGPQILHSTSHEHQEPLTDQIPTPPQAPANPCSTHPEIPAARPPRCPDPDATTQGGEDDGKRQRKVEEEETDQTKERRRTNSRSLQPPQPSKLRLFLSQTSRLAASSGSASMLKTTGEPERQDASGVKLKPLAFPSGSSRLPKPKSH